MRINNNNLADLHTTEVETVSTQFSLKLTPYKIRDSLCDYFNNERKLHYQESMINKLR